MIWSRTQTHTQNGKLKSHNDIHIQIEINKVDLKTSRLAKTVFLSRKSVVQMKNIPMNFSISFYYSRFEVIGTCDIDDILDEQELATADRSAKTLKAFINRIRNIDLTNLIDTGCKGCILCST